MAAFSIDLFVYPSVQHGSWMYEQIPNISFSRLVCNSVIVDGCRSCRSSPLHTFCFSTCY